jgi:hypothetical protein
MTFEEVRETIVTELESLKDGTDALLVISNIASILAEKKGTVVTA